MIAVFCPMHFICVRLIKIEHWIITLVTHTHLLMYINRFTIIVTHRLTVKTHHTADAQSSCDNDKQGV